MDFPLPPSDGAARSRARVECYLGSQELGQSGLPSILNSCNEIPVYCPLSPKPGPELIMPLVPGLGPELNTTLISLGSGQSGHPSVPKSWVDFLDY